MCSRIGYPTWHSGTRPCFCCAASPESLYEFNLYNLAHSSVHINTDKDFDEACCRCEIRLLLDELQIKQIKPYLKYDKRHDGNLGRSLTRDLPQFALLSGDRLEPTPVLPDVALFENTPLDIGAKLKVCFWRRSAESICMRRFPLWDVELGISPCRVLCIDFLHTLYLGVMNTWVRTAIWALLKAGVWGVLAGTGDEQLHVAVNSLRSELYTWYAAYRKANPKQQITQVADLSSHLLGTEAHRVLRSKGAETYGLLLFMVDMLHKHGRNLPLEGRRLRSAGIALVEFIAIAKKNGIVLPVRDQQVVGSTSF